jgi:membrane protein DedA with SNARE-associated domain
MKPKDVEQARVWFNRHGRKTVCFGRLVPAVRTLISVPAGIADIPLPVFLGYSTLGTLLWVSMLTASGYLLGQHYSAVGDYLGPVTNAIFGVIVLWYLWRVATFRQSVPKESKKATQFHG